MKKTGEKRVLLISKLHSASLIKVDPMMRDTERYLEKKRWKKGGSNGENLRELEKKRNCPFDAKKVCPVTYKANRLPLEKSKGIV